MALARHTPSPKIYLIGRSQSAADEALAALSAINPSAQATFVQADISVLKNVDGVCAGIAAKEKHVNLLFMTPGYLTLKGWDETADGLDRKFVLHYYARMRFVTNLLPLLSAAAAAAAAGGGGGGDGGSSSASAPLSRVVSVLDPHVAVRGGARGALDYADLSLRNSFSLARCGAHASLMGDFFLEGMAARHPRTSFVHAYPSGVATGVMREVPGGRVLSAVLGTLLRPWLVPLRESGERHLFAATTASFPPKGTAVATAVEDGDDGDDGVAVGSDGVKGSGCYWVNWNGEIFKANAKLDKIREEGAVEKVIEHTEEVFNRVCP